MRYVVDTVVFNRLTDGTITINDLPTGAEFLATHVQLDEIHRTTDGSRRELLLEAFRALAPTKVAAETAHWGGEHRGKRRTQPQWGDDARWGVGEPFDPILAELDNIEKKRSNYEDALLIEAAVKQGCALVTADRNVRDVAERRNVVVHFISDRASEAPTGQ
jgi:predicted nucleic acid-binding protein